MSKKSLEDSIKEVIDIFSTGIEEKEFFMAVRLVELLQKNEHNYKDPETFNCMVMSNMLEATEQAVKTMLPEIKCKDQHKTAWIYMNHDYLMNHIRRLKSKVTGSSSCEADVARFIVKMYLEYSIDGKYPDTDYEEHYYKPTFGENKDWMEFCDGLYEFYYGSTNKYLLAYKKLIEAPIRKYKHTLHELYGRFKDGTKVRIDYRWDDEIEIPDKKYVRISEWELPEDKKEKYKIPVDSFSVEVPAEDFESFIIKSKEVEV